MNPISFGSRSFVIALSLAPLLLVTACAADKPPVAKSAAPPMAATTNEPAVQSRTEPTSGTIAISDEIRAACGISNDDAFFAFDSAAIASSDIKPLDAVARCFTSGPLAGRAMRLIGHADPRGQTDYNMVLGQRRADAVESYVDRKGVERSRVATTSRGAMDATGQDEAGWARDRRVDVQLGS
jgi:peptidoglycan-associated lipoprotein